MIQCTQINKPLHQLYFEDFPDKRVNYFETHPVNGDAIELEVCDQKTTLKIFIEAIELRKIGISPSLLKSLPKERHSELVVLAGKIDNLLQKSYWYLIDHRLDISYLNRGITKFLLDKEERWKEKGVPGIYFSYSFNKSKVFINLKGAPYLGKGAFGKVRKVLWLNGPDEKPVVVAKKTLIDKKHHEEFKREINVLNDFSNTNGIVSIIAGGIFEGKAAIFTPLYDRSLLDFIRFGNNLTLKERLSVTLQWLEGLDHLSEKGIHGDLSPKNLVIKKGIEIKAVIIDFGCFRYYGREEWGLTNPIACSPEYLKEKKVSSKLDVWSMGVCLHGLFSEKAPSYWFEFTERNHPIKDFNSGWLSKFPMEQDTPKIVIDLITSMLDLDPEKRPTPKEAYTLLKLSSLVI